MGCSRCAWSLRHAFLCGSGLGAGVGGWTPIPILPGGESISPGGGGGEVAGGERGTPSSGGSSGGGDDGV